MKGMLSPRAAEKVDEIVVRSNFSDLTPETLLEAFKAEGIASLEDLATQLTKASGHGERQPGRGSAAWFIRRWMSSSRS